MCTSVTSLSTEPQCLAVQHQCHTASVQQQDEVLSRVLVRVRVSGRAECRQRRARTEVEGLQEDREDGAQHPRRYHQGRTRCRGPGLSQGAGEVISSIITIFIIIASTTIA